MEFARNRDAEEDGTDDSAAWGFLPRHRVIASQGWTSPRRLRPKLGVWSKAVGILVVASALVATLALAQRRRAGRVGRLDDAPGATVELAEDKERPIAFQKCYGGGTSRLTCTAGCQCMRENEYFWQCSPPEGSNECDIAAAKLLVKKATEKAKPFLEAEAKAHKLKNSTERIEKETAAAAAKTKQIADEALDVYEKKARAMRKQVADELHAAAAKVEAAHAEVKKALRKQANTKNATEADTTENTAKERNDKVAKAKLADSTAADAKDKQANFDKKAAIDGKAQHELDEKLGSVKGWAHSLEAPADGVAAFNKCGGSDSESKTCAAGCMCIPKNDFFHQCQPPGDTDAGRCDAAAAKALVEKVKSKNAPLFATAKKAKAEKEIAGNILLEANTKAKKAKEAADQALSVYESTRAAWQDTAAVKMKAEEQNVAGAKKALKEALVEQVKVKKETDEKTAHGTVKEAKRRDVTHAAAVKAHKLQERALAAKKKAFEDWKEKAGRLRTFYSEVKGWKEALQ
eukprot:CAMPEP_0179245110 /NCGR_PEP_ID=MMETSP0797-20121207/18403_1 /TAXON_ID=47934 /ORGANISM="Dinophysis acuminata, Strain DAEP01" /LENGTH=517 /DNA_ID=CAMNT_0020952645 /DNA_START=81 /DNA_END=1634 /DNA_ORIENTATION=+